MYIKNYLDQGYTKFFIKSRRYLKILGFRILT